jgi:uncharacterized membrane protein YeaQ/YmgE (transglycosylase-associated protein family)
MRFRLHGNFVTKGVIQEVSMSFLAWIVLGLISGFIASKIVNKSGSDAIMDIVLGIVGAVVGGWLFNTIGRLGVTGVNLYSILVAVVVQSSFCLSTTHWSALVPAGKTGEQFHCMLQSTLPGEQT